MLWQLYPPPVALFQSSTNLSLTNTPSATVTVTNQSTMNNAAGRYDWGDGLNDALTGAASQSHTYTAATSTVITLSITNIYGTSSWSTNITVMQSNNYNFVWFPPNATAGTQLTSNSIWSGGAIDPNLTNGFGTVSVWGPITNSLHGSPQITTNELSDVTNFYPVPSPIGVAGIGGITQSRVNVAVFNHAVEPVFNELPITATAIGTWPQLITNCVAAWTWVLSPTNAGGDLQDLMGINIGNIFNPLVTIHINYNSTTLAPPGIESSGGTTKNSSFFTNFVAGRPYRMMLTFNPSRGGGGEPAANTNLQLVLQSWDVLSNFTYLGYVNEACYTNGGQIPTLQGVFFGMCNTEGFNLSGTLDQWSDFEFATNVLHIVGP